MTKVFRLKDVTFYFGAPRGCSYSHESGRHTCSLCGKKFLDHGLAVFLDEMYFHFELCGDCLTADPKRVAEKARKYAPILRKTRPRRGDDADMNTRWADDLLLVADLFDTLDSLDAILGGTLARKIGEGYREMEAPRPQRTRKAA